MKPFLKWVGGKTQILDTVLSLFPTTIQNYHEPFVGGGSVLLGLLSSESIQVLGTIYASDLNANLIGLYKNIQSHPDELIAETKKLVDTFKSIQGTEVNRNPLNLDEALTSPESYYYWIRKQFNSVSDQVPSTSAMMLFLNKTCFRGVYREGPNGFNVPFGHYKNPSILEDDHIRDVSRLLQPVVFTTSSYADSLARVVPGDFVYLDPPYAPETSTSFVSYTADGFGLENHTALFELCNTLAKKGVKLSLSNADVPLVRQAFPSPLFTTTVITCRRAIHSKKPETVTNEVLITTQQAI